MRLWRRRLGLPLLHVALLLRKGKPVRTGLLDRPTMFELSEPLLEPRSLHRLHRQRVDELFAKPQLDKLLDAVGALLLAPRCGCRRLLGKAALGEELDEAVDSSRLSSVLVGEALARRRDRHGAHESATDDDDDEAMMCISPSSSMARSTRGRRRSSGGAYSARRRSR